MQNKKELTSDNKQRIVTTRDVDRDSPPSLEKRIEPERRSEEKLEKHQATKRRK